MNYSERLMVDVVLCLFALFRACETELKTLCQPQNTCTKGLHWEMNHTHTHTHIYPVMVCSWQWAELCLSKIPVVVFVLSVSADQSTFSPCISIEITQC